MARMVHTDRAAIDLAHSQGGVLTRAQALALGFTRHQLEYRLETGRWQRVSDLGYRLLPSNDDFDQLMAAVSLLPAAVVSHESAGALHGFRWLKDAPATVSVHSRTTHSFEGVVVKRCHDLHDQHWVEYRGLRLTTPARTVFDLAASYGDRRLNRIVSGLMDAGHVSETELEEVLASVGRRGKPGTQRMRKLLAALGVGSHASELERRGRLLLPRHRCGCKPVGEYEIPWLPRRRFDDAYPRHKVAVEWDSVRYHGQRDSFESDRQRDRTALERGWRVLRFTWVDVNERSGDVTTSVSAVLDRYPCEH